MPTFTPISPPFPPAGNYGDITFSGGQVATINANAVTNADLAQAPGGTVKGNLTSVTANVTDVTVTALAAVVAAPPGVNYVVDQLGSVSLGADGLEQPSVDDLLLQGIQFSQL